MKLQTLGLLLSLFFNGLSLSARIKAMTAIAVGEESVAVHWTTDATDSAAIFTISLKGIGTIDQVKNTDKTKISFDGLIPFTQYEITVSSTVNSRKTRVTTWPAAGGSVEDVQLEPRSPTSVFITWNEPNPNYGEIKNYLLTASAGVLNNKTIVTELNSFTFENLQPASNYTFYVSCENHPDIQSMKGGGIGSPVVTHLMTWPKDYFDACNLTASVVNSSAVIVNWSMGNLPISLLKEYRLNVTAPLQAISHLVNSTKDLPLVIGNLTPFTNYCVSVLAVTKSGEIGQVVVVTVITPHAAGLPVQNLSVTSVNSTTIRVHWEPPHDPQGAIKAFRVQVTCYESPKNLTNTTLYWLDSSTNKSAIAGYFVKEAGVNYTTFRLKNTSTNIVELEGRLVKEVGKNYSTIYTVNSSTDKFTLWGRVFKKRESSISNSYTVHSIARAPIPVRYLVTHVGVNYSTICAIDVSTNKSTLQGYLLKQVNSKYPMIQIMCPSTSNSTIVGNLKPGSAYEISVATVNWEINGKGGGPGYDISTLFNTTVGTDIVAYNVTASAVNSSSILVSWSVNNFPPRIFKKYRLIITETTKSFVKTVNTTEKPPVAIGNLRAFTMYSVSIIIVLKTGSEDFDEEGPVVEVRAQTLAAGSFDARAGSIGKITKDSIEASWLPPVDLQGTVERYFLTAHLDKATRAYVNISFHGHTTRGSVGGLASNKFYEIYVQAKISANIEGRGGGLGRMTRIGGFRTSGSNGLLSRTLLAVILQLISWF